MHDGTQADVTGSGDATPVLFINGLGTTTAIWDAYVQRWRDDRRLLRFNLPGHGGVPAPQAPIGIGDLADRCVHLLDRFAVARCHVIGVSMGGMIAQWLGARMPDRVASLTIASAGVRTGSEQFWQERARAVRLNGLETLSQEMPGRWFSDAYREAAPEMIGAVVAGLRTCDAAGYAACCEAIGSFDGSELAEAICAPTLVLGGDVDPVTGPEVTRDLAGRVRGARYEVVAGAGHLLTLERPDEVAGLVEQLIPTW